MTESYVVRFADGESRIVVSGYVDPLKAKRMAEVLQKGKDNVYVAFTRGMRFFRYLKVVLLRLRFKIFLT